jgi:hypothetical protein
MSVMRPGAHQNTLRTGSSVRISENAPLLLGTSLNSPVEAEDMGPSKPALDSFVICRHCCTSTNNPTRFVEKEEHQCLSGLYSTILARPRSNTTR